MRSCVQVVSSMFAAAMMLLPATEAQAQGFFESLFGGGGPSYSGPASRPALPPPVTSPYGYRTPLFSPYRNDNRRDDDDFQASRSGHYRTLCVRLCDGYYWPVSHAVNRSSFYRDANVCRASCGEEAKLFYHPASQGDVSEMVDLTGRAYVKLSTAFRYRKALSPSCKCRPDPWAQSELDRHRRYALNESADDRLKRDRVAERPLLLEPAQRPQVLSALPPSRDTADSRRDDFDTQPVPQPEPIETPLATAPQATPPRGSRPAHQKRTAPKPPAAVKPAKPLPGSTLFGLGGPSKSRWPGD